MNDIDKMTQMSQAAMQEAAKMAEDHMNPAVEPEHLALTLLTQNDGVVPRVLEAMNVNINVVVADVM